MNTCPECGNPVRPGQLRVFNPDNGQPFNGHNESHIACLPPKSQPVIEGFCALCGDPVDPGDVIQGWRGPGPHQVYHVSCVKERVPSLDLSVTR